MSINEVNTINNSIKLLRAYAHNEQKVHYKVTVGLNFRRSKVTTKKKTKTEDMYFTELSKMPVYFPHEFGKAPTIALFTFKNIDVVRGIDYLGSDNLIKDIVSGTIEPNYVIAFKDEMPLLNKHSRILGPRGLMPTPKQGTIVEEDNIIRVVESLKKSSFRFKLGKALTAYIPVGYLNMDDHVLSDNINTLLSFVRTHLPITFLRTNLKKIYITTTHGPSSSLVL